MAGGRHGLVAAGGGVIVRRMRHVAVLLVVLALPRAAGAVGEPSNGFPSPVERLGLMAINRARSDPETIKGSKSASYPARPPVIWSLALNQSARFHATNLKSADVSLMHDSPCLLNANVASSGCTGDVACACASPVPGTCAMCASVTATNNGCGSSWSARLALFLSGTNISLTGEVAAAGYPDPIAAVDGWMDEAAGDDGHRKNLTDQGITSNTMGYGRAEGKPACLSSFDVSDSGTIKNAAVPKIPTAAVSPASGNAGTFTFYATWADPAHGAPATLNAVVDGSCLAMTRELGTDTLNATYKATTSLTAGCHEYWISASDATGAAVSYPTAGALTISVGGTACGADYVATASGSCGADAGVPTTGSGGTAAGGAGGRALGGSGGERADGGDNPGGGGADGAGPAASGGTGGIALGGPRKVAGESGGCSCDTVGRAGAHDLFWLAAALGLALGRRRPRCTGRGSVRR